MVNCGLTLNSISITRCWGNESQLVDKKDLSLYISPPGYWTCSFVCHLNSAENIQSCSHFGATELIIHIAISVLPHTHFHLSHLRRQCLAQEHNIEKMSQYYVGRNMIIHVKSYNKRGSKLQCVFL